MTKVETKLRERWNVDLLTEARHGTVLFQAFAVFGKVIVGMTFYDCNEKGEADLSKEVGGDIYVPVSRSPTWDVTLSKLNDYIYNVTPN